MSLAQQYADFANEIRIKCHYKLNDTQILNNYVTISWQIHLVLFVHAQMQQTESS